MVCSFKSTPLSLAIALMMEKKRVDFGAGKTSQTRHYPFRGNDISIGIDTKYHRMIVAYWPHLP